MLRIPPCIDNRLTDGGKVEFYEPAALYPPQKHHFSASTHFWYRLNEPQGLVRPEGLGKLKKFILLIGSRTHDLPVCSIVP
jgi:hypothetical protein